MRSGSNTFVFEIRGAPLDVRYIAVSVAWKRNISPDVMMQDVRYIAVSVAWKGT